MGFKPRGNHPMNFDKQYLQANPKIRDYLPMLEKAIQEDKEIKPLNLVEAIEQDYLRAEAADQVTDGGVSVFAYIHEYLTAITSGVRVSQLANDICNAHKDSIFPLDAKVRSENNLLVKA